MKLFFLGFLWFFLISMQTRIVAFANNPFIHGVWTFLVSIVWVYLIKGIILMDDSVELFMYAVGTAMGSVVATVIHCAIQKGGKID